jgi:zinc protease
MKHFPAAVVLALTLIASAQTSVAGEVTTEISPGGIEYVRLYMPDTEDVAIQIAWPTDWVVREEFNHAVADLGAELIFAGGAEGFPPGEISEVHADLNAQATVWFTSDHLHAEIIAPKDNLEKAVESTAVHLSAPSMDAAWLERVRQENISIMAEEMSVPINRGYEALRWAILGDTSFRRALSGNVPELYTKATREQVLEWHRTAFVRNDAEIVIAGAINAVVAGKAVDTLFSQLPEGKSLAPVTPKADFSPRRILLHVPEAQTSTLEFFGPLPPTRMGGEVEDLLLASILGGSDNSVLFDAVRTGLRASYGFGAGIDGYSRELRFLFLAGEVETGKLAEAETIVRTAYAEFLKAPQLGDLSALKRPLATHIEQNMRDPITASFPLLVGLLDGQDPDVILRLTALLEEVTDETLHSRASSAFPSAEDLIVLAVSPDATALPDACVIKTPPEAVNCR